MSLPQRISLVTQTMESLRAHIRIGQWLHHLPAERELCQFLQVSRPTLRAALEELQREGLIVLSGHKRAIVPEKLVSTLPMPRVVAVLAAKSLQEMPKTSMLVIDALRDSLAKVDYAVELRVDRSIFSAKPGPALEKMVHEKPAAVWIALGSKETMQRWFLQRQLPLLVIGSCRPDIALTSVDKDYRAVCRHAGDLLWRKGHRRLALVMPKDIYDGDVDSEEGIREALSSHPGASLRVLRHNGSNEHLCSLLDGTLQLPHPPTGYLVLHPMDVLTVLTHLMRRRVRIPEDAAVLCRDDEIYLQQTSPVISRYAIDPAAFARQISRAARELAKTGRLAPKAIRLIPSLISGETISSVRAE
jgi:DNA-binding LacI/PurR family transcriptional regulator/DNA-binding transcriptional regulator YhcF (GntR family)